MPLRHQYTELVADFLARGGAIRKCPTPEPTVAADVLEYLQDHDVDVYAVFEPGEPVSNYVYQGRVISEKQLIKKANRHRSRRRLPPFELVERFH